MHVVILELDAASPNEQIWPLAIGGCLAITLTAQEKTGGIIIPRAFRFDFPAAFQICR